MTTVLAFQGKNPVLPPSVLCAEGSRIIGDVEVGEGSSLWFNVVVRGDVNWIRIGERTNIQDNATLHVTNGRAPLKIGSEVTVGHAAILHGCTVGDGCLIGMGSIILDHAVIEEGSIVAAGSVVRESFTSKGGVLIAGNPAIVKRDLTQEERRSLREVARRYVSYAHSYMNQTAGAARV